jgi:glycosyltransferase involved in cell wall biosynthesis
MIYLDISAAVHARAGLGRYAAHLAQAVAEARPWQITLFHNGGSQPLSGKLAQLPRRTVNYGYKPWRTAVLLGQLSHLSFNRLVPNAELFHATEHLLMPLRGVPTILTVHDLIFKLFPEYHKKLNYWYLNLAMPLYCQRATKIVAVSAHTKRDLVEHYQLDPAKIVVVHEAAAEHFVVPSREKITAVRQTYNLPDQFLIHLSTIEPRKNLPRLLEAFQRLRQSGFPDLHLILVGAKGWLYDDFFAQIEKARLGQVVRALGWVPDEDLPAVLAAASLAVQPSLYEGFGLPILEAMACGQVVAASHASSFPEIGGNAAAYFDPLDVAHITAVIQHLLTHPDEYQQRRELGLAQSQRFSWHKTAQETIAIYDEISQTTPKPR